MSASEYIVFTHLVPSARDMPSARDIFDTICWHTICPAKRDVKGNFRFAEIDRFDNVREANISHAHSTYIVFIYRMSASEYIVFTQYVVPRRYFRIFLLLGIDKQLKV